MKLNDRDTLSIAAAVSDVLEGKKPVQEMDPKKHVKKDEDSGMFCDYNTAGKKVKEFESKDEAEKYAADNHDDLMSEAGEPKAKGEKDFKAKHTITKSYGPGAVKEEKDDEDEDEAKEGNKFTGALNAARKAGDDTFVVAGKTYTVSEYDEKEDDEDEVKEAKSKFAKPLLKKATDLALKMGGNMTNAIKKIEKMKKGLSDDPEVKAALQMANEAVSEEVVEEAHAMNEAKTKMQEDKERYQKFFKSALKKFGVTSPGELEGDKKKEFFDYVDKNYEADNEAD